MCSESKYLVIGSTFTSISLVSDVCVRGQVRVACSSLSLPQSHKPSNSLRIIFTFTPRHHHLRPDADMSFAQTLWALLAQTYTLHDRTAPVNNMTPQEPDELYKQQDAALKQLGNSHILRLSNSTSNKT